MLKSDIVKEIAIACGVEQDHVLNPSLGNVGEPSQYCKELMSLHEIAAYEAGSVNRAGGVFPLQLEDEHVSYPPGVTPEIVEQLIKSQK
jgi:hypothetical protein